MTSLEEEEVLLFDNYSYYDGDYPVYEDGDIPAIPLDGNYWPIRTFFHKNDQSDPFTVFPYWLIRDLYSVIIDQSELLVPVLVYSVTYITGLIGNILILVAVTGQKQVSAGISDK